MCYSLTGLGGLVSQEQTDSQVTETVISLLRERGAPLLATEKGRDCEVPAGLRREREKRVLGSTGRLKASPTLTTLLEGWDHPHFRDEELRPREETPLDQKSHSEL